jgi:uncharacterized protein (DUF1499 family)
MDNTMNKLLIILASIVVLIVIAFFILGVVSKKGEALGLKDGHLQACTSTDNCVISEVVDGNENTVEPFVYTGEKADFFSKVQDAVTTLGGKITTAEGDYIAATFTSGIFGFVDDVELRVTDDNLLHFRSASRVGRKDFGANKKRVDALKAVLSK